MALHRHIAGEQGQAKLRIRPQVDIPAEVGEVPRFRLGRRGLGSDASYQVVHDELLLDGNARLNVATFVTTWMDHQADRLMTECSSKNLIDKDEYPQTAELEHRCVNILADLWNASGAENATGCSTTGSSEACMLGGMALKWNWRRRRASSGAPADRPNLVMGANVQVVWEKFCRYWDVEARLVPVGPETHLTASTVVGHCDDQTIGVVAVLGSTFDGAYEPVLGIARALDDLAAAGGPDVPIHVDGASGAFVAPFIDPDLVWDFRIPRVVSINASGHKYGLVYPGVGWVVWRDAERLPEDLVFKVDYLGGEMPTFSLNFSRPGAQVAAQYYNFLRLGFDGYRRVMSACRDNARWLAAQIERMGPFELVSRGEGIPVFAFRVKEGLPYSVYDVSEAIRGRGWLVPAYPLPPNLQDVSVLRVVVRDDMSRDLAESLVEDIRRTVEHLGHPAEHRSQAERAGFHH